MNTNGSRTGSDASSSITASGVSILLIASSVILISVLILFGYITGILESQNHREDSFQARLTEESSIAMLKGDLISGSILDYSRIPEYEMEGQTTRFSITEISTTPPEVLTWTSEGDSILRYLTAGDKIFVLSRDGDDLLIDLFPALHPEDIICSIRMDRWGRADYLSSASVCEGEPCLFLAGLGVNAGRLVLLNPSEEPFQCYLEEPFWDSGCMVSSGSYMNEPSLVFTGGTNRGYLFQFSSMELHALSSPPGTVPVLYGQGKLFGEEDPGIPLDDTYSVTSIIESDFDGDALEDLVFTGPRNAAVYFQASGEIVMDSPENGVLVATGTYDKKGLLSMKWVIGDGVERWRVFLEDGFVDAPGPEFLPYDWRDQLHYSRASILGTISDSVVVASENTGRTRALCPAVNTEFQDLDGQGMDVLQSSGRNLNLLLNPLEGDGLLISLNASTYSSDNARLSESAWNLRIYGSGENKRIRVDRVS